MNESNFFGPSRFFMGTETENQEKRQGKRHGDENRASGSGIWGSPPLSRPPRRRPPLASLRRLRSARLSEAGAEGDGTEGAQEGMFFFLPETRTKPIGSSLALREEFEHSPTLAFLLASPDQRSFL